MRLINRTYVLVILTCFMACEKDFVLEKQDFQSHIVVKGIFEAEHPWNISLHSTRNILDSTSKSLPINDAKVVIANEKHEVLYSLESVDGVYTHATKTPKVGETYILKVTHADYPRVEAESYCPMHPRVVVSGSSVSDIGSYMELDLRAQMVGTKRTANMYLWELERQSSASSPNVSSSYSILAELFYTKNFNELRVNQWKGSRIDTTLVIDRGSLASFEPLASITRSERYQVGWARGHKLSSSHVPQYALKVVSLSSDVKEYYEASLKSKVGRSEFSFQNPARFPSNIKGGYGLFGGTSSTYIKLQK